MGRRRRRRRIRCSRQVVGLELIVFLAQGKEMQLLRQQAGRADFGTFAAADAGQCWWWRWQLFRCAGQQAVGGLDQRHIQRGQGEAHHRPAHDQAVELAAVEPGESQQFSHRCADQCLDVHRLGECCTGQGGDAGDQWLAQQYRIVDRDAGADVLAEHANIGGQAAAWHFFAGENLDQLFFTAGRVLGRKHLEYEGAVADGSTHGFDGFGLVVLNADQHLLWLDQVFEYLDAGDQLCCFLAHQQVIGSDVGLALGAVDDQCVDRLGRRCGELHGGREASAAEAADTRLVNHVQQLLGWQLAIVGMRLQFDPLISAITVDDNRRGAHARNMGVGLRADEADGARGGSVQWRTDKGAGLGDQLALEYLLADRDTRLGRRAQMLAERDDQTRGQRHLPDRCAVGEVLVLGWVDATVDIPDAQ